MTPRVVNPDLIMSNETLDLMQYGCFLTYDPVACARSSFLGALVLVTLIFIVKSLAKTVRNSSELAFDLLVYQFFVLLFSLFLLILCLINWLLGAHLPQIDLAASCMKLVILINVLLIYGGKALRLTHRLLCVTFGLMPMCFCIGFYGLFIAITGMNDVGTSWNDCFKFYWILLSTADYFLVIMITVAAVTIHRSTSLITIEKAARQELLKRLWIFVILLQISALVTLGYDISVRVLGGEDSGCSSIFLHSQMIYSGVMTVFMTAKFLLPIWGFLYAFERRSLIHDPHETKVFVVTRGDHTYRVLTSSSSEPAYDDNKTLLSRPLADEPSTTQAIFGGLPLSGSPNAPSPLRTQGVLNPKDYWRTRSRHSRGASLAVISEEGATANVRKVSLEVHAEADD